MCLGAMATTVLGQGNTKANRINAGPILPTACNPATGDVFYLTVPPIGPYFCASTNVWVAIVRSTTGGAVGLPPFTASVTNQTSVTDTAAQHSQGTKAIAACFDSSTGVAVDCSWSRNSSGDITFTFSPAWSGVIQITGYDNSYISAVTNGGTVSIPASTHGMGTLPEVFCFDVGTNIAVKCQWTRTVTGDVTLTFNPPWTGTVQITGLNVLPYTTTFTNQTSVSLSAGTHGQGTTPDLACFDTFGMETNCSWLRDVSGNLTASLNPSSSGVLEVVGGSFGPSVGGTGGVQLSPVASPVCDALHEGAFYYSTGTPGVFQVCSRLTNGSYGLRPVVFSDTGGAGTPGGASGTIQYNNAGSFGGFTVSGDGTLNSSTGALSVTKVHGTSVPVNSAADQVLGTTASATGSWFAVPNCQDSSGNHLNYNTSTHVFSCGTSSINLTGDVTSTGATTTVVKVNGASVPASASVLGTNSSSQPISQTGQAVNSLQYPNLRFVVGGANPTPASVYTNLCATAVGSGYGTCEIYDYTLPHSLNTVPWCVGSNCKIIVKFHFGPGVLTLCDSSNDPDGNACTPSTFVFATGTQGGIFGVGTSLSAGDTGTIIRAGASMTSASSAVIIWGSNTTTFDSFGAQIRDLQVDCNNVSGLSGIKNTSTQEASLLDTFVIKNCSANGIWQSSVKANNSQIRNGYVVFGTGLTSKSIGILLANAAASRPIYGVTVDNPNKGTTIATTSASYSAASSVGTITGLSYSQTTFGINGGPNSSPTYILIGSVGTGWNGVWRIVSNTGCSAGTCTGMTVQLASSPGNFSNVGTLSLVPTYGVVACAGAACSNYGGDTSGTPYGDTAAIDGIHVEHVGEALYVTSTSALAVNVRQLTCTSNIYDCVHIDNQATTRSVLLLEVAAGGAPNAIVDGITGRTTSQQYIGRYETGTPAATTSALVEMAVPYVGVELATPTSAQCVAGSTDCLYPDSSAHRWMMINNGGTAAQVVASGADINTSDQVTGLNGASITGMTGILTLTSGTPSPAAAGTDFTLGAVNFFYCSGGASSATTIFIPNTNTNGVCSGTSAGAKIPLMAGHVIANLRVRSSAAGANASSGAVTLLVNAGTSTTLTCTVGTGTTCVDTTHTYTTGAGDALYVQITTQSSETLANISVSYEIR